MKVIEVVAGIIRRKTETETIEYFVTQRGYGDYKGMWEFPGGKVEAKETREQALVRELREELAIDVSVGEFVCTVEYDYPNFHLVMHCYYCAILEGAPTLLEHEAARWLSLEQLKDLQWCPADVLVVEKLC